MATLPKNLIAGCAFNYSTQDILPFLNSLQACGYLDDLLLLTNNQSNINLKGYSYKGIIINVDRQLKASTLVSTTDNAEAIASKEKSLLKRTLSRLKDEKTLTKSIVTFFYRSYFLMTSRYFLYYYYLTQLDYTCVFLTDVNDVFFQKNPFDQKYKSGITAFAEYDRISIAEEVTNRFWIQETFGDEVLESIGDEVVYCAGTIMVKDNLKQFLTDFLNIVITQKISPIIQGVDQGVFNYMLSYLKLDYFNCRQNGDTVLTVANVPESMISISKKGISLAKSKTLPNVVHQYTRFEQQKKYVQTKYHQLPF